MPYLDNDKLEIALFNGNAISVRELSELLFRIMGDGTNPFQVKGDLLVGKSSLLGDRLLVGVDGLFLKADSAQPLGLIWSAPAGSGDVVGPASAVDDHIVLFNGISGKAIKTSLKTIADIFADHVALGDPHSQYALDTDLAGYQLLDTLLTDISSLS